MATVSTDFGLLERFQTNLNVEESSSSDSECFQPRKKNSFYRKLGDPQISQTNNCTNVREPDVVRKRKLSSSSDEQSPNISRSSSLEILISEPPSVYSLQETQEEEFFIVKKAMGTPRTRQKKYTDQELAALLNADDDSDDNQIFTSQGKPGRRHAREGSQSATEKTPRSSGVRERKLRSTPSRESSKEKASSPAVEVSLRMKIRRSTEQSNYKIERNLGEASPRASSRSTSGTPKKCGIPSCDLDHSAIPKKISSSQKTRVEKKKSPIAPITRRTRPSSISIENNLLRENDEKKNSQISDKEEENQRKRNTKLLETPRSAKRGRKLKPVDEEFPTEEKENKSESDSDPEYTPRRGRRQLRGGSETPKKQPKILEGYSTPVKNTPRTPRRNVTKMEEPTTPASGRKSSKWPNTPSRKNGNLTPSMSRRTANVGKPITALQEARAKLHVSAVPKSLPCREEEFNNIYEFLERKMLDNRGGCIYISGVPGTGKTATVNEVVRCLKKLVEKGDLDSFQYVEVNGMKLSEPRQAYVQILKQLNGQTATWEQAHQILEKRFTQASASKKSGMTLMLVDELDLLCNKRQDVVYNLLDWPAKANAQLVVITIANTMDLPERVLMGRVTSRLGLTRLTFQPYNHKQLQEIVMARLRDSDAFKSEAIQLVARKVAAVSGDARRALDICRRATEITELKGGNTVTMNDVNQALTEMISSAKVQAIKHCSEMEKMFLQAVCAEIARTGVEETNFHNVYLQLQALCSFEGLTTPNVTQSLGICGRLGANRLLLCEHSRTDIQQRILLNVSSDDIHFALQTAITVEP